MEDSLKVYSLILTFHNSVLRKEVIYFSAVIDLNCPA